VQTEEAANNAFVMPFISNLLSYEVFDPSEVVPEFHYSSDSPGCRHRVAD
jgi:hypothetical protein